MLRNFASAHGLSSIALRYFNAAAAAPGNERGEHHDRESHLIPLVLDAASGRRPHVTILGSDHDTPDGSCVRDYVQVSDLAEAHALAIGATENGTLAATYNPGNGSGFSILEVIDIVERVKGSDATKAREKLGWQSKISDLADIMRSTWAWYQRRGAVTKDTRSLTVDLPSRELIS